jgi:hypothetical protein
MKISEVIEKEKDNDRSVIIHKNNGIPTRLEVIYSGGSNSMSFPHTVGFYVQTVHGWERE